GAPPGLPGGAPIFFVLSRDRPQPATLWLAHGVPFGPTPDAGTLTARQRPRRRRFPLSDAVRQLGGAAVRAPLFESPDRAGREVRALALRPGRPACAHVETGVSGWRVSRLRKICQRIEPVETRSECRFWSTESRKKLLYMCTF